MRGQGPGRAAGHSGTVTDLVAVGLRYTCTEHDVVCRPLAAAWPSETLLPVTPAPTLAPTLNSRMWLGEDGAGAAVTTSTATFICWLSTCARRAAVRGTGQFDIFIVPGHDSRLGQVVSNLLSNAQSFSEPGNEVQVAFIQNSQRWILEIIVDDDGPGIREDALSRIFERFYTDRPHQGFGQNSGLGLRSPSRSWRPMAEGFGLKNRTGPVGADGEATVAGARFVVRLPT